MIAYLKKYWDRIFIIVILFFFTSIFSFIAIQSHNHFATFGWDLGFFDQIIWKVSQGDLVAYSTIAMENLLADHFQVVLYLLAPLYWIRSDVRMILIAQAFLVVFAAYPIFLLAKQVSKHVIFSFAIVLSYLLFAGTQWTMLNEFHQMAFAPLFISLAIYFLHKKNVKGFFISIVGLLVTKEELGLLVASLGFVVWGFYKMRRVGLFTIILGTAGFFALVYIIMPAISVHGVYSHFDLGEAGYTPMDAVKRGIGDPGFVIKSMISPSIKLRTIFDSFLAFGFLPLAQPILLIPILGNFATRFIYAGPQFTKWVNVNHHAASLGPLLAVTTIYASAMLVEYLYKRKHTSVKLSWLSITVYITACTLLQNIILHGPINSFFKYQLYVDQPWMRDVREVIARIPKDAVVAAQNSIVPHVSQRNAIYLLPEINDAQYIVVDLHDGPNKFSPLSKEETQNLISVLIDTAQFRVHYSSREAMLLKKVE